MTLQNDSQAAFFDAILGPKDPDCERLQVYRDTVLGNLQQALSITFPGIWKLLGDECANQLALAFCLQQRQFPTSGCLDDWGSEFPAFIASREALQTIPYLEDYAQYEWLQHLVTTLSAIPPMNPAELATLSPEEQEDLGFELLPGLQLFHSRYPIQEIEAMLENPDGPSVTLRDEPSHAVITHTHEGGMTLWCEPALWKFLHALKQGHPLTQSYEQVTAQYPEFDLMVTLSILFQYPIFETWRTHDPAETRQPVLYQSD